MKMPKEMERVERFFGIFFGLSLAFWLHCLFRDGGLGPALGATAISVVAVGFAWVFWDLRRMAKEINETSDKSDDQGSIDDV